MSFELTVSHKRLATPAPVKVIVVVEHDMVVEEKEKWIWIL
jgi:hypothetical protein